MIVITGAAGFIGSCIIGKLNREGFKDIVAVDDFSREDKLPNLEGKLLSEKVERESFFKWLNNNHRFVQFIVHIGARTDTAEFDEELLEHLNLDYSKKVWNSCVEYSIPLMYASSAATYGSGEYGYDESVETLQKLQPLNPYGESKQKFDLWALEQEKKPFFWVGLKFFNVYGPNEYHKGRMANVIYHLFKQAHQEGKVRLFKSHREDYEHGEQKRDFIYIKDVLDVIFFLLNNRKRENSGIYNLGSGKAATFNEIAENVFRALGKEKQIEYIDTPKDIRDKYQYFTEAKLDGLRKAGYEKPFTRPEEGIKDYIQNYLLEGKYY